MQDDVEQEQKKTQFMVFQHIFYFINKLQAFSQILV